MADCEHGTAAGFTCLKCETARPAQDTPRTFFSPAYLVEVERKLFGLYRDVLVQDPKTGQKEKMGRPVGPIGLFREAAGDEPVHLRTTHPTENRPMTLTRVSE